MIDKIARGLGLAVIATVMVVVIAAIMALPVKWLWNDLMPGLFHLSTITWFQAWELAFLCGTLFKSTSSTTK